MKKLDDEPNCVVRGAAIAAAAVQLGCEKACLAMRPGLRLPVNDS